MYNLRAKTLNNNCRERERGERERGERERAREESERERKRE